MFLASAKVAKDSGPSSPLSNYIRQTLDAIPYLYLADWLRSPFFWQRSRERYRQRHPL